MCAVNGAVIRLTVALGSNGIFPRCQEKCNTFCFDGTGLYNLLCLLQMGIHLIQISDGIKRLSIVLREMEFFITFIQKFMECTQFRTGFFPVEGDPMFFDGSFVIEIGIPHTAETGIIGIIVEIFQSAILVKKEFCIPQGFAKDFGNIADILRHYGTGKWIFRNIVKPERNDRAVTQGFVPAIHAFLQRIHFFLVAGICRERTGTETDFHVIGERPAGIAGGEGIKGIGQDHQFLTGQFFFQPFGDMTVEAGVNITVIRLSPFQNCFCDQFFFYDGWIIDHIRQRNFAVTLSDRDKFGREANPAFIDFSVAVVVFFQRFHKEIRQIQIGKVKIIADMLRRIIILIPIWRTVENHFFFIRICFQNPFRTGIVARPEFGCASKSPGFPEADFINGTKHFFPLSSAFTPQTPNHMFFRPVHKVGFIGVSDRGNFQICNFGVERSHFSGEIETASAETFQKVIYTPQSGFPHSARILTEFRIQ